MTYLQQQRTDWSRDELRRIAAADELRVEPRLPDGALREPVTIWVVAVGGRLFVRSAHGQRAPWWRAAHSCADGRIRAAGIQKPVVFETAPAELNDAIDAAYRTKYRRYSASLVQIMVTPEARDTTLELIPRKD